MRIDQGPWRRPSRASPASLVWLDSSNGGQLPANEVPAGARWAGRFIAAVGNSDTDQTHTQLGALRTNDEFTVCLIETPKATSASVSGVE